MNDTSRGERVHIGIFGRRNAGKSSLINAITGQEIALVSEVPGTTADPVYKSMELLPVGPVVLIDTAGLDDAGVLGEKRAGKSFEVLGRCDLALVVIDSAAADKMDLEHEAPLVQGLLARNIQGILVVNKSDSLQLSPGRLDGLSARLKVPAVQVSSLNKTGIDALKALIIKIAGGAKQERTATQGLVSPGDIAVLVTPIDSAAPKGRLILPQVQVIRDVIDAGGMAAVVKETGLPRMLGSLNVKPRIVITDSQAFRKVSADTPADVALTSFSILFARYKGDLNAYLRGIAKVKSLKDGDRVLMAEACTHHVQPDDIGTVKIPVWLKEKTGLDLKFEKSSGPAFPGDLKDYALVVQCGGCMVNRREILNRIAAAESAGVPITNYGMLIAHLFGVLERALSPFSSDISIPEGSLS